jgi:hypothetical protein
VPALCWPRSLGWPERAWPKEPRGSPPHECPHCKKSATSMPALVWCAHACERAVLACALSACPCQQRSGRHAPRRSRVSANLLRVVAARDHGAAGVGVGLAQVAVLHAACRRRCVRAQPPDAHAASPPRNAHADGRRSSARVTRGKTVEPVALPAEVEHREKRKHSLCQSARRTPGQNARGSATDARAHVCVASDLTRDVVRPFFWEVREVRKKISKKTEQLLA